MRILIVDDEEFQRRSIKHIIESADLGIEEVLIAANAIQGQRIVDELRPEIVLSDIMMPEMDGLEFAEYIRGNYPETVVLLITGYNRFEYAHAGIEAQVFDYILKPIDKETVLHSVKRAVEHYRTMQERRDRTAAIEHFMHENRQALMSGFLEGLAFANRTMTSEAIKEQKRLFEIKTLSGRLTAIQVLSGPEETFFLIHRLRGKLAAKGLAPFINGNILYVLLQMTSGTEWEDDSAAINYLMGEMDDIPEHVVFRIGLSASFSGIEHLEEMREQAEQCLSRLQAMGDSKFLIYDDMDRFNEAAISASIVVRNLCEAVRMNDMERALEYLDTIEKQAAGFSPELKRKCISLLSSTLAFYGFNLTEGEAEGLFGRQSFSDIRKDLIRLLDQMNTRVDDRNRELALAMLYFMREHYREPLGLNEAAASVGRSANYAGHIFKTATGQNYSTVLTEVRISEAKRLLVENRLQVQQIASHVGYTNARTFYRVFAEQVGLTANNYRMMIQTFGDCEATTTVKTELDCLIEQLEDGRGQSVHG